MVAVEFVAAEVVAAAAVVISVLNPLLVKQSEASVEVPVVGNKSILNMDSSENSLSMDNTSFVEY